jgi:superoxide dismutase, Cu-Zn family
MHPMWTGRFMYLAILAPIVVALGGCTAGEAPKRAIAQLDSRAGSTVSGMAIFEPTDGTVTLTLTVTGATPGIHASHLHAEPDCSAPDATSAGGHWNPTNMNHGLPDNPAHHVGDLGNLMVDDLGNGEWVIPKAEWTIGTGDPNSDVIGHALIFHQNPDDGVSQPAGAAGARHACGVTVLDE